MYSTCSSCFSFVGVRPVVRLPALWLISLSFHRSRCRPLLSTFLPPLPVSGLSSDNPSILAAVVYLIVCNLLVALSQIFSLISLTSSSVSLAFPIVYGRRRDCWSSYSMSACPSSRLFSAPYLSRITGMRLSVSFPVVLSSVSIVYPLSTLSSHVFFISPRHVPVFNHLSVIVLAACATLVVPGMCSYAHHRVHVMP